MHEKILQGVTIGVVAGLFVYWLTSKKEPTDYAYPGSRPQDYKPLIGDIRTVRFGKPSDVCCCASPCSLITHGQTYNPLAADYLPCGEIIDTPEYQPATSGWNLGISLQLSCEGIDLHSGIDRKETATSFPYGIRGPNTLARPINIPQKFNDSPDIPVPICCTEVV